MAKALCDGERELCRHGDRATFLRGDVMALPEGRHEIEIELQRKE